MPDANHLLAQVRKLFIAKWLLVLGVGGLIGLLPVCISDPPLSNAKMFLIPASVFLVFAILFTMVEFVWIWQSLTACQIGVNSAQNRNWDWVEKAFLQRQMRMYPLCLENSKVREALSRYYKESGVPIRKDLEPILASGLEIGVLPGISFWTWNVAYFFFWGAQQSVALRLLKQAVIFSAISYLILYTVIKLILLIGQVQAHP